MVMWSHIVLGLVGAVAFVWAHRHGTPISVCGVGLEFPIACASRAAKRSWCLFGHTCATHAVCLFGFGVLHAVFVPPHMLFLYAAIVGAWHSLLGITMPIAALLALRQSRAWPAQASSGSRLPGPSWIGSLVQAQVSTKIAGCYLAGAKGSVCTTSSYRSCIASTCENDCR